MTLEGTISTLAVRLPKRFALSELRVPILLAGLYSASFIDQGMTSMVSVALPDVAGSLGAPGGEALWSNVAFSTAYYTAILATPWVITRFGSKRHYVLSLAGVALASIMCAIAPTFAQFTLWRLVQGLALGGVFVNTLLSLILNFKISVLRFAVAGYGIFSLGGPALGPTLSGIAVDYASWRWLFVGIAVFAALTGFILYGALKVTPAKNGSLDVVGLILLAATSAGYNVAVQFGELHDWLADPIVATSTAIAAFGLAAFILWELYGAKQPLLPLRILSHRGLQVSLFLGIGLGLPLFGATVFLSYLQSSLQFTPTVAGLTIAVRILAVVLCAPAFSLLNSFKIVDTRIIVAFGFTCTAASYAVQAINITTDSWVTTFVVSVLLSGIGFGAIFSPLVFSTVMAVGLSFASVTIAFFKMAFTVGGSVANAALGVITDHRQAQHYSDLAETITLARPTVAEFYYSHYAHAAVELLQTVSSQAQTMAFADAAWVTAIATLAFVPFIVMPTARDEEGGRGVS